MAFRFHILALVVAGAAGGCSSSSTYRPMTVEVRDSLTRQPVAGASVVARTVHFFVPGDVPLLGHDPIIDPGPPRSARAHTGDDGRARLKVIVDHPVQVMVLVPGYDVQVVDLKRHPAVTGQPSEWLDSDPPDVAGPHRLQVRFLP